MMRRRRKSQQQTTQLDQPGTLQHAPFRIQRLFQVGGRTNVHPQMTAGLHRFPVLERFVIYGSFSSPLLDRSCGPNFPLSGSSPWGKSSLRCFALAALVFCFMDRISPLPRQADRQQSLLFLFTTLSNPLSCAIYDPPPTEIFFHSAVELAWDNPF